MPTIDELINQASTGGPEAQFNLASAYENGQGVAKDINQAIFWYTKVAEQGFASAQYNLGNCYQDESIGNKDYAASAYWYGKATEQGHLNATYMLAICYKNGEGVPQNIEHAKELLKHAASKAHEPSQRMLDRMAAAEMEAAREARDIVSKRNEIHSSRTPPPVQPYNAPPAPPYNAPQQTPPYNAPPAPPYNAPQQTPPYNAPPVPPYNAPPQAPPYNAPQQTPPYNAPPQAPIYNAPPIPPAQKKGMNGCLKIVLIAVAVVAVLILFSLVLKMLGLS